MIRAAAQGEGAFSARQFAIVLTACLMLFVRPVTSTSAIEAPRELDQKGIATALHRLSARRIRSNEYELEKGVILRLVFTRGLLTGASVSVTRRYQEAGVEHLSDRDDNERACCMSKTTFDRFRRLIDGLKTIGAYDEPGLFGVIGPSGWVTWVDSYQRALVSRFARTCPEADQSSDCGISSFTVTYYSSVFRGLVRSKHVDSRDTGLPFGALSTYSLVVGDKQIAVSQQDFERVREGTEVEIGVISKTSPAKVLGLRDQRR